MAGVSLRAPISHLPMNPAARSSLTVIAAARPANEAALLSATSVHPVAVAVPVAAFPWFVLAAWIAFAGGETSLVLAFVTFLTVMYFRPDRRWRSFGAGHDAGTGAASSMAASPAGTATRHTR